MVARSMYRLRFLTHAALALALGSAFVVPGMHAPHGSWLAMGVAIIALSLVSNLVLMASPERFNSGGAVMAFLSGDVLALTLVLVSAGGALNPFTALYYVQIALAAVLLRPRMAVVVVGLAVAGFASLFLSASPHAAHGGLSAHLQGMWIAFVVAAGLIAAFVLKLHRNLEQETARTTRVKQVAALTSLAASAAHELGSPIGTIALATEGLEDTLDVDALPQAAQRDLRLLRSEIQRCHDVLRSLSHAAGGTVGENFERTTLLALAEEAVQRLGHRGHRVELVSEHDGAVCLPRAAVITCLVNLLQNALDAGPAGEPVKLHCRAMGSERVAFEVRDLGPGMTGAAQASAVEPFVSSKAGGAGLGLFLTQTIAEQLAGALTFDFAGVPEASGVKSRAWFVARLVLPEAPPAPELEAMAVGPKGVGGLALGRS